MSPQNLQMCRQLYLIICLQYLKNYGQQLFQHSYNFTASIYRTMSDNSILNSAIHPSVNVKLVLNRGLAAYIMT